MRSRLRLGLLEQFALLSLIPFVVLGWVLNAHFASTIKSEALANARDIAQVTARFGIQPHISAADLSAGLAPDALARVDTALRAEQIANRIVRVKIWNRAGRIVYSDNRSLIGKRFDPDDDDELESALAGHPASDISDLEEAEQRADRHFGHLLEVYVPLVFSPGARPAGAFELYMRYTPIAAHIASETRDLALYLIAGLAAVWALLMRIMIATSKRLRRQAQQLREKAEENHHQATHDALTGLPNRTLFQDRASQAVLAARRDEHRIAVLLLDLDRFKEVNDTLGHRIGDLLLGQVGPRLEETLRASDTVARLGGDEFAVLLRQVSDPRGAMLVGESVREALAEPFALDGLPVQVEASVGVSLYPDHGADVDTLLQHADIAMYQAKGERTGCAVYDPSRDRHSVDRLALLGELRAAISNGRLVLHYQPKLRLETQTIEGVEALLRWDHPTRGLIPPGEFVPSAEHTELMTPLTKWVIEEALTQAAIWRAQGFELGVSVNVSAVNLADDRLVEIVADKLGRSQVPPRSLTLEVTESAVMADPMRARQVLDEVADSGVRIALDDFGVGHSSLAYLKRLPVDELKIDRSFISHMLDDPDDSVIVSSTIELARSLGLSVVAEGPETPATLLELSARGCDLVQGFAVSRPLAPDKLALWLAEATRSGLYTVAAPPSPRPALATTA